MAATLTLFDALPVEPELALELAPAPELALLVAPPVAVALPVSPELPELPETASAWAAAD
jgi:hypothetical protein